MRLLHWKRGPAHRLDHVVVPEEAVAEGSSPFTRMMYVQMFINDALGTAMWMRDELPHDALVVAHLADYLGEVNNGGHAQFVGNTGWDEDMRADIQEGLARLGLPEPERIFADLEAFAVNEPERFKHNFGQVNDPQFLVRGRKYTIDAYFSELDDRFYQGPSEALANAVGAWIESRPSWLRVIPDAEYNNKERMGWKTPDHPRREARWAARWRREGPAHIAFFKRLSEYLFGDQRPN